MNSHLTKSTLQHNYATDLNSWGFYCPCTLRHRFSSSSHSWMSTRLLRKGWKRSAAPQTFSL